MWVVWLTRIKMKKINLITTLSPEKQYEIRRWFWVTIFLSVCIIAVGAYFVLPQVIIYRSLHKDIARLRQQTKQYGVLASAQDTLKKEHDELHVREAKINARVQQKKNPHQHITEIVHACGDGVQLHTIRFNKKEVEMTIMCPTAEHAQVFVKRLVASSHFSHVKMTSLQSDEQSKQLRCIIKGNVIF
jgi:Tfp pilus assembly protein PilN